LGNPQGKVSSSLGSREVSDVFDVSSNLFAALTRQAPELIHYALDRAQNGQGSETTISLTTMVWGGKLQ
jgi:hypothetical protein